MKPKSLSAQLADRVVIFDGGFGTELYRRNFFVNTSYDDLNLSRPEAVTAIHQSYVDAGVDVLTTNTYNANSFCLSQFGLADRAERINQAAVALARKAAAGHPEILVAGSIGPAAAGAGINKGVFREAVTIQMSWPGAPTVYYADEAGQVGWTDPDNRRTYPWGHEDHSLVELHRDLIRLRKDLPVLRDGSLKPLLAEYGRIAYARFDDDTRCIIAVNNTGGWTDFRLFARDAGALEGEAFFRRIQTSQEGHETVPEEVGRVADGFLAFDLPPFSSVILCNSAPEKEAK